MGISNFWPFEVMFTPCHSRSGHPCVFDPTLECLREIKWDSLCSAPLGVTRVPWEWQSLVGAGEARVSLEHTAVVGKQRCHHSQTWGVKMEKWWPSWQQGPSSDDFSINKKAKIWPIGISGVCGRPQFSLWWEKGKSHPACQSGGSPRSVFRHQCLGFSPSVKKGQIIPLLFAFLRKVKWFVEFSASHSVVHGSLGFHKVKYFCNNTKMWFVFLSLIL